MNELQTITSGLTECKVDQVPFQMISIFKAVTPQFYKNMSEQDIKAEITSIQLLTQGIDTETLAEMCQRAVKNYAKERSENEHTYFNINYVMKFYKEAYNYIHCDSVALKTSAVKIAEKYDEVNHILWQKWREPSGREVEISNIQDKGNFERFYSPKDYANMFVDIDDIEEIEI